MARKMDYQVTIQEVDNGYVVRVGCALLVFGSWEKLWPELNAYAEGENTDLSRRLRKCDEARVVQAAPPEVSTTGLANQTI